MRNDISQHIRDFHPEITMAKMCTKLVEIMASFEEAYGIKSRPLAPYVE